MGYGAIEEIDRANRTWATGQVLPVYTRLSDAEESEREKLADISKKNLNTGVQNLGDDKNFEPLDAKDIPQIVELENQLMGTDAWNNKKFEDELKLNNRS